MTDSSLSPAYGGPGWRPRTTSLNEELGTVWGACGLDSEWLPLRSVLLHRPGQELEAAAKDPEASLMVALPDQARAGTQHDALADAYREEGVVVHYVEPPSTPPPNQLFAADLMAMTPAGAILGRPASTVRAGEERWVARALGALGVPILRSVGGTGSFEGADLMWLSPRRALLGLGIRTNPEGARQVENLLNDLGVETVRTKLPPGTMHLMGQLRIVDRDLAIGWPGRLPASAHAELEESGFQVAYLPDEIEAARSFGLNFVVLGPRHILMPAGNPRALAFYEGLGVRCRTVEVDEIGKAAGSIGCSTAVLRRDMQSTI